MKICLMIEGQEGVTWPEWRALAAAAEASGLHGLFRSDHYTSFHAEPAAALDAWATISGLAAITERLRLGTLVSPATFRHPSELARVVAAADHISGGRVELGLGAGWFEGEHRQNGFPFPSTAERFDRLEEYVEVVVDSWQGEVFDFSGTHFTLEAQRALPPPVQQPGPPLILGGQAKPRSLALAARYASEYNVAFADLSEVGGFKGKVSAACAAAGRDPGSLPLSLMTLVALGSDEAESQRRLDRVSSMFRVPRERCFAGTVDQVADRLSAFAEAGVHRAYLQHPDRQDFAAIELMGDLAAALSGV